jgi:hypothetical protein
MNTDEAIVRGRPASGGSPGNFRVKDITSYLRAESEKPMLDLAYVLAALLVLAGCWAYARACDRL